MTNRFFSSSKENSEGLFVEQFIHDYDFTINNVTSFEIAQNPL
jgi:hypothetical protein